ncbi:MAG: hypothetical protein JWQ49_1647 [Edaphobacter sp.]|nr:hypothetical protein [Edaphobacter sp.]
MLKTSPLEHWSPFVRADGLADASVLEKVHCCLPGHQKLAYRQTLLLWGHFAMLMCGIMSTEGIYEMATNNLTFEQYIGVSPNSALDMAEIAEKGLPTDSIAYLKKKGLTFSEVSEIVISPRTLKHRKARGEQLSVEETDRMLRVARIILLADQVFGNHEKALTWLRQIDERINDRTPLSMLHTESGGRLVENLLWQIDEGVYS